MEILLKFFFIGGAIGLIIGIIKSFIKPKEKPNPELTNVGNRECPQCAELIKNRAKVCRFCNYKFTVEELVELEIKQKVEIMEDAESNWYFIYKDPSSGINRKYIYLNNHSAEESLIEIEKGNGFSKMGLLKVEMI